jgi:galactitol-specific phosphotransferase system IIB component
MVNIVNLTPHDIVLCGNTITSSGVARCVTNVEQIGEIAGVKINRKSFGEVTGLPEPKADTIYIVSAIVAQAISGKRNDVFIVDDTIRNEQGQIIGCNALAQV